MGKTIYIQCYEGLSAKMMVEALLNLMPEPATCPELPGRGKGSDDPQTAKENQRFCTPRGSRGTFSACI